NERVNFAVEHVQKTDAPGVIAIADRLARRGDSLSPDEFIDGCLEFAGPLVVSDETRAGLMTHAQDGGDLKSGPDADREEALARVSHMLRLIVAAPEFQFG
ncbi:MAG: hypothetical protein IIC29_08655, partial [Chloroflexi bacterium]|nr:hypothetical protein [Chloroflexota bacterium]